MKIVSESGRDTLYLYGAIGGDIFGDGITAAEFKDSIQGLGHTDSVLVRINSPGGDVFEATAIRSLLSDFKSVDVRIDGVAASAASYVATVGQNVSIAENGMVMLHEPWTLAVGTASEMRATAKLLDKVGGQLIASYAAKSGQEPDDVAAAMTAETWLTGPEAVTWGLVDEVLESEAVEANIDVRWGYRNLPRRWSAAASARSGKPQTALWQSALTRRRLAASVK